MKQEVVVDSDEATLTPEMADAWAKVFLNVVTRLEEAPMTSVVANPQVVEPRMNARVEDCTFSCKQSSLETGPIRLVIG